MARAHRAALSAAATLEQHRSAESTRLVAQKAADDAHAARMEQHAQKMRMEAKEHRRQMAKQHSLIQEHADLLSKGADTLDGERETIRLRQQMRMQEAAQPLQAQVN